YLQVITMIKLLNTIKYARLKKKVTIYLTIFRMIFDFVLFTYIAIFLAYLGYIVFHENININALRGQLPIVTSLNKYYIAWFVWLIIFTTITRRFSSPILLFSTAEWKLLALPYQAKSIYHYLVFEKAIKSLLALCLLGIIYNGLSQSQLHIIIIYMGFIWLIYMGLINMAWRFFTFSL